MEKLSADTESATRFISNSFSLLVKSHNLCADQIYNADETGLWYKVLPQKTLATNMEKSVSGFKGVKDRVTVLVCANASGEDKLS